MIRPTRYTSDLLDVDFSTPPAGGQIEVFDGPSSKWKPQDVPGFGLVVSSVNGRSGAVSLSVADVGLSNVLNIAQEPVIAAGVASQYWRGDKSWQTLNTDAVAEGLHLYYTDGRASAAAPVQSVAGAVGAVSLNQILPSQTGMNGKSLRSNGTNASWQIPTSGTVTSVGISLDLNTSLLFTVGSPVTSSGSISFTEKTQSANTFWAGPTSGADTTPSFRTAVPADIAGAIDYWQML